MFLLRSTPLPKSAAEALSDLLGLADQPEALSVSSVEVDEALGLWQVEAHYEEEPDPDVLAALGIEPDLMAIEPLPDVDWVARSLEALPPVRAGRFTVHGSHDRERIPPGGVAIEIDASTAFGTGHHATTRACLMAIDGYLKRRRPRSVLDVGCGTGILGIAVALGARSGVVGTDIDVEAVRVAGANARRNLVPSLVKPKPAHPLRLPSGKYDLVLANILAGPLVTMSGRLSAKLAAGGELVVSGLLRDQERAVRGAYLARGLVDLARIRLGEWSTLIFRKPLSARKKGAPGTGRECRARRHQSGRRRLVRISGSLIPRPSTGSRSA